MRGRGKPSPPSMANLSNLIHELRERIAASSSSSSISGAGEDPLETKFRTVLPNLLLAYVLPSSTGISSLSTPPSLSWFLVFLNPARFHSKRARGHGRPQASLPHRPQLPWRLLPWPLRRRPPSIWPYPPVPRGTCLPVPTLNPNPIFLSHPQFEI